MDQIRGEFEAALSRGEQPRIEERLGATRGRERSGLLRQLLAVEVKYRYGGGEVPEPIEYVQRFPDDRELIESIVTNFKVGSASHEEADREAPLPFSDYALVRELGGGGMGVVYEAVQLHLKKRVALKVLRELPTAKPELVTRFFREARAVAQLRHPHIVGVHGIGRTDKGGYFLAMDLVEGSDLERRIARGKVAFEEAANIVATIADAVQHAHDKGIIHRDLKPSNVLLDEGQRPLLTDFGLAKLFQYESAKLTGTSHLMGTPPYMAPEQAGPKGGEAGPWTDVYGLGGILYALLTGEAPYRGESLPEVLAQVVADDPPEPPSSLRRGVPEALEAICLSCLAKAPEERYGEAADVALALRHWLSDPEKTFVEDLLPIPLDSSIPGEHTEHDAEAAPFGSEPPPLEDFTSHGKSITFRAVRATVLAYRRYSETHIDYYHRSSVIVIHDFWVKTDNGREIDVQTSDAPPGFSLREGQRVSLLSAHYEAKNRRRRRAWLCLVNHSEGRTYRIFEPHHCLREVMPQFGRVEAVAVGLLAVVMSLVLGANTLFRGMLESSHIPYLAETVNAILGMGAVVCLTLLIAGLLVKYYNPSGSRKFDQHLRDQIAKL